VSALLLWLGVAAAGGAASLARFLLDALVSSLGGSHLPWGTLAVNVSGAVVLGVLVGLGLHGDGYLLAGTAVIGSYTTFSTWMFESHRLAEDGSRAALAGNIGLSLLVGVCAIAIGRAIGGG
jgi:CrcB protein